MVQTDSSLRVSTKRHEGDRLGDKRGSSARKVQQPEGREVPQENFVTMVCQGIASSRAFDDK
jgi:hypothetical protein